MARFSEWSRKHLEDVATEMLDALIRARQWIERDEGVHGRTFGVGNEVRKVIAKADTGSSEPNKK